MTLGRKLISQAKWTHGEDMDHLYSTSWQAEACVPLLAHCSKIDVIAANRSAVMHRGIKNMAASLAGKVSFLSSTDSRFQVLNETVRATF